MMRSSRLAFGLVLLGAACGAVEVPTERTYRLPATSEPARVAAGTNPGVLRVQDLRLAAHVSAERLMVADGPALLRAHELDRWAGPLDRLLTDFLVLALRRTATFADVKGPLDGGAESNWLQATVRDFHYQRQGDELVAIVAVDVQLRRAADASLLVARELQARVPAKGSTPSAAVQALAAATEQVVAALARLCRELPADAPSEPVGEPAVPVGR
jgi:uncharacterized lipoprotein YmbA